MHPVTKCAVTALPVAPSGAGIDQWRNAGLRAG